MTPMVGTFSSLPLLAKDPGSCMLALLTHSICLLVNRFMTLIANLLCLGDLVPCNSAFYLLRKDFISKSGKDKGPILTVLVFAEFAYLDSCVIELTTVNLHSEQSLRNSQEIRLSPKSIILRSFFF